jgi:hypothetical protein
MGLGRHRSARHGVVSARAARGRGRQAPVSTAGWLTRQDAAKRAGVHYNTIRQWERAGLLTTTRKPRVRGSLINVQDLQRVLGERASMTGATSAGSASSGADAAAIAALSRKVDALVDGLEQLLSTVRSAGATRRGPGRPLGSKNKPKSAPPAKKASRKPKRRARR